MSIRTYPCALLFWLAPFASLATVAPVSASDAYQQTPTSADSQLDFPSALDQARALEAEYDRLSDLAQTADGVQLQVLEVRRDRALDELTESVLATGKELARLDSAGGRRG